MKSSITEKTKVATRMNFHEQPKHSQPVNTLQMRQTLDHCAEFLDIDLYHSS